MSNLRGTYWRKASVSLAVVLLAMATGVQSEIKSEGVVDIVAHLDVDSMGLASSFWGEHLLLGTDIQSNDDEVESVAIGAYLRMNGPAEEHFVFGVNIHRDLDRRASFEFQANHEVSEAFGYGVGYAKLPEEAQEIAFARLSFAKVLEKSSLQINPQVQAVNGKMKLGAHFVHASRNYSAGFGHDGEQWRAGIGYVQPEQVGPIKFGGEAFYWNSDVGAHKGERLLFINATLRNKGGFLTNSGRAGRLLGAAGVHYDNPISYLSLVWNRTPEVWEFGDIWNVRYVEFTTADDKQQRVFETAVFPVQLLSSSEDAARFFVGFESTKRSGEEADTSSISVGYTREIAEFSLSIAAKSALDSSDHSLFIGFRQSVSF